MNNIEIGKFIRDRRLSMHISLEQVANICGVSKSTASRWETGNIGKIKRSHIYLLSQILYIPVETILGIETEKTIDPPEVIISRNNIKKEIDEISNLEELSKIDKFIKTFILDKKESR